MPIKVAKVPRARAILVFVVAVLSTFACRAVDERIARFSAAWGCYRVDPRLRLFEKVKPGMTEAEVVALLGPPNASMVELCSPKTKGLHNGLQFNGTRWNDSNLVVCLDRGGRILETFYVQVVAY